MGNAFSCSAFNLFDVANIQRVFEIGTIFQKKNYNATLEPVGAS